MVSSWLDEISIKYFLLDRNFRFDNENAEGIKEEGGMA